jgi:hypothetical protein
MKVRRGLSGKRAIASQKDRFRPARQGVCEGVGKRCFVRPILTKASGKKDRFPMVTASRNDALAIELPVTLSSRP